MNRGLFGLVVLRLGNARYCDHIGYMLPHLLEKKWKNQWLCARRGACTGEHMGGGNQACIVMSPILAATLDPKSKHSCEGPSWWPMSVFPPLKGLIQFQYQPWIHSEDTVSGNKNNQSTKERLLLNCIHLLEVWRPYGWSHHLEGPLLLNATKLRIKVPPEFFSFKLPFYLLFYVFHIMHVDSIYLPVPLYPSSDLATSPSK